MDLPKFINKARRKSICYLLYATWFGDIYIQGSPQKCPCFSYFSLAITFTKIRKPSRFFLHRYWKFIKLFWWKQSIMFSYIFSVINIRFVPCTVLLYDSTAATRTLKLSTTLLSISCGIHLISFLMMSSFVCGLFSQTLSFRYPLTK